MSIWKGGRYRTREKWPSGIYTNFLIASPSTLGRDTNILLMQVTRRRSRHRLPTSFNKQTRSGIPSTSRFMKIYPDSQLKKGLQLSWLASRDVYLDQTNHPPTSTSPHNTPNNPSTSQPHNLTTSQHHIVYSVKPAVLYSSRPPNRLQINKSPSIITPYPLPSLPLKAYLPYPDLLPGTSHLSIIPVPTPLMCCIPRCSTTRQPSSPLHLPPSLLRNIINTNVLPISFHHYPPTAPISVPLTLTLTHIHTWKNARVLAADSQVKQTSPLRFQLRPKKGNQKLSIYTLINSSSKCCATQHRSNPVSICYL